MQYFDVLLVNPSWSKLGAGLEHLGLGYMAACLRRNGITVKIIDATIDRWNAVQTLKEVNSYSCKLIGVSIPFQEAAGEVLSFITMLKASNTAHISVGGIYPSFAYRELMQLCPAIDSVAIGEGEETVVDMAKCLIESNSLDEVKGLAIRHSDSITLTAARGLVEDLDSLPHPARDTLPRILPRLGFASMITSRGCYGRCSFCSVVPFYSSFGPRYRVRSWENVMEEIDLLHDSFGVKNIMFNDANFIGGSENGKNRAARIAEEMLRKGFDLEFRLQCRANDVDEELFSLLKKAGLTRVYIGIESGSQSMLDRFKKDITLEENYKALEILNKLDLFVSMGFIMFDDRISLNELNENNIFLRNIKNRIPSNNLGYVYPLSRLLPLAGTDFEAYMKGSGKYKGNSLNYTYSFDDKLINVIYSTLNGCAGMIWKLKVLAGAGVNSDKNWTGGWRVR